MTAQTFVKQKYPNAQNMYREGGGHAIQYVDKEGNRHTLAYGNNSANAWKNAKENIEKRNKNNGQ